MTLKNIINKIKENTTLRVIFLAGILLFVIALGVLIVFFCHKQDRFSFRAKGRQFLQNPA
jgi:flagellar biosynthesis/type III secretory pathway M-ring protein FliF/YscJ